jgi:hypothetical protein
MCLYELRMISGSPFIKESQRLHEKNTFARTVPALVPDGITRIVDGNILENALL